MWAKVAAQCIIAALSVVSVVGSFISIGEDVTGYRTRPKAEKWFFLCVVLFVILLWLAGAFSTFLPTIGGAS